MKSFLEGFEQRMNVRFDVIDTRSDAVDGRFNGIDARLDGIDGRLDAMDARFDGVDTRLDGMDVRFTAIEVRLDRFERNQNDTQEQIAYLVGSFGKFADDIRKLVHSYDVRITNLESRVQFV